MSLGAWLRRQKKVKRVGLQIYAGKAVHILQFRRCLFSVLQEVFKVIAQSQDMVRASTALYDAMLVLESLLPVVASDLKAKIDPVVTASDASETGGGACYASRLSRLGVEELDKMMEEEDVEEALLSDDFRDVGQKIVVVDLFAGIGGLDRALPWFTVAVESDPDCRRRLRRRFPGLELCADIKKVDRDQVKQWLRKIPDANGVIVGGGSPCQGLSKLSVDRRHVDDERSALFHDAVRVMKLVKEEASLEGMWCVRFLENVVPDDEDIRIMSKELDLRPLLVDSKHLSRARRPRLFWLSIDLIAHQEVEIHQHELFDEVWYGAATEPMHAVLSQGCRWQSGENDTAARFPTMTRAQRHQPAWTPLVRRAVPGGSQTVTGTLPIHTTLNANERKVLMGFQKEDQRCAAIGNAFHAVAVAALFDHALWSFGVKPLVGHHEIVEARAEEIKREAQKVVEPSQEISLDPAPTEGDSDGESDATQECSWKMESKRVPRGPASSTAVAGISESDMNLAVQMVQAFVRRQEFRGRTSDWT